MAKVTRRAFISTSMGAATGVAAMGLTAPHKLVEAAREATQPEAASPGQPVMAYVRDSAKGEVSVMVGHREVTTRDTELVKRLMRAAR